MTGWPIKERPGWSWRLVNRRNVMLTGPDGLEVTMTTNAVGFTVQVVDGPKWWVPGPSSEAMLAAVDLAEGTHV